ncbi:RNA polymerase sigma factor [Azoarcus olearius]|uniref:Probable RNA polymerase sigma-E factor (Sigma-24) n=1 Tax=Azoarcus sp. (strain BH72) TaxID=418699 RepID=A1K1I8_AZOSB|nr:RNA polymerase sigma factor [Azoarcus olearius]CAL92693.1 probable RNA polymerase sigma-E factor (sigma-24) [Azoarcus olearius]
MNDGALSGGAADDGALMLAYAAGDAAAFEQLYARHRRGLYAYLQRQAPRPGWVDDLFQETWLAVIGARAGYRPSAAFRTWLYGIARNKLIDRIRRSDAVLLSDFLADDGDDGELLDRLGADAGHDPAQLLARRRDGDALHAALRTLPAPQREVFLLREQADMSLTEIAALVGVPLETAKSRLRYAIARLRAALAEEVAG